jgi:hypothetical protein
MQLLTDLICVIPATIVTIPTAPLPETRSRPRHERQKHSPSTLPVQMNVSRMRRSVQLAGALELTSSLVASQNSQTSARSAFLLIFHVRNVHPVRPGVGCTHVVRFRNDWRSRLVMSCIKGAFRTGDYNVRPQKLTARCHTSMSSFRQYGHGGRCSH